jgi:hypothetical protein
VLDFPNRKTLPVQQANAQLALAPFIGTSACSSPPSSKGADARSAAGGFAFRE